MITASEVRSGKGHRDENFPVASWLIDRAIAAYPRLLRVRARRRRHRGSCDAQAGREARAARPARGRASSATATATGGGALAVALAARGLSPHHAQDLLTAFRMDVTKLRYGLGRPDSLLQLFGHAGRALRARRARREPVHVAGERCAVRGAADHQSPAGLREGFPRAQSRLYPARCVRAPRARAARTSARTAASPKLLRCIHDLAARNERAACARRAVFGQIENTRLASRGRGDPPRGTSLRCCRRAIR